MSLDRFVEAQASTYAGALADIRQAAKRSHWMWFIFPQLIGWEAAPLHDSMAFVPLTRLGRILTLAFGGLAR